MKKYNISIDNTTTGYPTVGNIFKILMEIIKNPKAKIIITPLINRTL